MDKITINNQDRKEYMHNSLGPSFIIVNTVQQHYILLYMRFPDRFVIIK